MGNCWREGGGERMLQSRQLNIEYSVAIGEGRALRKRATTTKGLGDSDITASGPRQCTSSLQYGSNKVRGTYRL